MAEYARGRGLDAEVARFEAWEPAGRFFDVVTAAQSWHWVDPGIGIPKAASVLRPDGRLAIFSHVFEPPDDIAEAFRATFQRVVPDSPFNGQGRPPFKMYQAGYAKIADTMSDSGAFENIAQWRFDWTKAYTREEWLDLLPTTGGLTRLPADKRTEILDAVGTAIDARGGAFTMECATLAATGLRRQ